MAEHEAVLNATDSKRRVLVPGPNGPAKWMQLSMVGAAGGAGGGRREGGGRGEPGPLGATPGTSKGAM